MIKPIRTLGFTSRLLSYNNNQYYSYTVLESAKEFYTIFYLELTHRGALTFYTANLASNSIYISDSQNSLEIPATQTYYFINFEMTTKLSVLKFISSIKNIIAVGLPGLL